MNSMDDKSRKEYFSFRLLTNRDRILGLTLYKTTGMKLK